MLLNLDYIMNTTVIMPHYSIILTINLCNNQAFEDTYAINITCKYVYVCLQSFGQRATVWNLLKVVRAYCSAQQNSRMLCNIASTAADRPLFYNNSQLY